MHLQEILQLDDTIVSQVTHGGTSGVSILRLSGCQAHHIAGKLLKLGQDSLPKAGSFALRSLYVNKLIVDKALILTFKCPRSLTGEDVIEIHVHGNPLLVHNILSSLIQFGARQANPGEFLFRGYKNNKFTLNELEALGGLLSASSSTALKLYSPESQTRFQSFLITLRQNILSLWAHAEAYFDFSDEEDVSDNLQFSYYNSLEDIAQKFDELLQISEATSTLGQANEVCLIGPPNAGKSSLLNALVNSELAIVSDKAGTTRDFIQGEVFIGGYLVKLIDTAGLRISSCDIEQQGVVRSKLKAKTAQCVLYLQDSSVCDELDSEQLELLESISAPIVQVLNKSDLVDEAVSFQKPSVFSSQASISVKNNSGINNLKKHITKNLGLCGLDDLPYALNSRQKEVVKRAYLSFNQAQKTRCNQEISVSYLREASDILGEILGDQTSDDVLGKIFGQFCIGK